MILANLFYDEDLVNHKEVSYIKYLKFNKSKFPDFDSSLPSLIVGWNLAKKIVKRYELDILEKTLKENLFYWEFAFSENRKEHINGIVEFISNILDYYHADFKYEILDPTFLNIKSFNDLMSHIATSKDSIIYQYKSEMVYYYADNVIYGIHLPYYQFLGIDLIDLKPTILDSGEHYEKYQKIFPDQPHLLRYIGSLLRI